MQNESAESNTLRPLKTPHRTITLPEYVMHDGDPLRLSPQFFDDLAFVHRWLTVDQPRQIFGQLSRVFDEWRAREQEQIAACIAHLPADDPIHCRISLFGTMDAGRLERAHTRTLAWLLSPKEPHGFGSQLLQALLQLALPGTAPVSLDVREVAPEYPIDVPGFGSGLFDILVRGTWQAGGRAETWLLIVEAKVGHVEGEGQLQKYDAWLAANAAEQTIVRVFLTPDGVPPETGSSAWVPVSFARMVRAFRAPLFRQRGSEGYHFLRFYLAGVLRDVCRWPVPLGGAVRDPYSVLEYLREADAIGS
jgi:hypothetical protein